MWFHVFKQVKSQLFLKVLSTRFFHAAANLQSNADLNPFNYMHYYKCIKYSK